MGWKMSSEIADFFQVANLVSLTPGVYVLDLGPFEVHHGLKLSHF